MKTFVCALIMLAALAGPVVASDNQLVRTNTYALAAEQSVSGQLLLLADQADLAGTVGDDVFTLTRAQANFTGENQGDTWVLSGQASLGGIMKDHVRAAGQSLMVRGQLERSFFGLGTTIMLATGSVVRGDVMAAGENITLEGAVGGNVNVMAQSVTLSGTVDGSVRVVAQDIVVMPGTLIAGDLSYVSPKELFLDSRVQLGGKLKRIAQTGAGEAASTLSAETLLLTAIQWLGALLVGIPFAGLFPRVVGRATRLVRFNPLRCMLAGFAALFLMPLLAVAGLLTVVGLPLGLLAGGLAAALLYLGKLVVGLTLGGILLRRRGTHTIGVVAGAMAIGLVLLYASFALPVIGGSLALLVAVSGSGALWWSVLRGEGRHEAVPPPVPPEAGPSI